MTVSTRKIAAFAKLVAGLADVPNLASSTLLKQWFDSSPEELRVAVNGLIDDLISTAAGASGTEQIGSAPISGVTGATAYAQLVDLKTQLTSAVMGSLTDETKSALTQKVGIINGNFDVWQRGTAFTADGYTADRWNCINFADSGTLPSITRSKQIQISGDLQGSYNFYRLNFNGAGVSLGTNSYGLLQQPVEYGTRYLCGLGKKITISFWARSSIVGKRIGVYAVQNYGTGGSPSPAEQLNGANWALTSTWTRYSFTITTSTLVGKTFGTNNDDYLTLLFNYAWGTVRQGAVGASTAETFVGSGNVDITQVQVSAGDQVLPYQPKNFVEELALCQRYYEKSYNTDVAPGTALNSSGIENKVVPSNTIANFQNYGNTKYSVKKRTTPTVIIYPNTTPTNTGRVSDANGVDLGANSASVTYNGFAGFTTYNNSGGAITTVANSILYHWTSDAEL